MFTETVSFVVHCAMHAEVDHDWERSIADDGKLSQCGWPKDKFGLSGQLVPDVLIELLLDKNPAWANASCRR